MVSQPTREQFADLAFAEGVVWGARSFDVTDDGLLTGCTYKAAWTAGENVALCFQPNKYEVRGQIEVVTELAAPHPMTECRHGFYAYYDGSNDYRRPDRVAGVIQGYGETLIGTRGFRCMKARIVALMIPEGVLHQQLTLVQQLYRGIPFFQSFEAMVLAFPPDKGQTRPVKTDVKEEQ